MLGGILTQSKATWRAIFYFQAGLGAFFIALGCFALRSDHTETTYKKGLDWGGALLSTAGMALLTYSLAYVNLRRSSPFLAFAEMTQTHFVSHPNCGFDHSFSTFLFVPDLTSDCFTHRDSTTARHGWRTPQIPSLFSVSLLLIAAFIWYERRREARGLSVLMPPSMWNQPGARVGSLVALIFFAWFSFNSLNYFQTL